MGIRLTTGTSLDEALKAAKPGDTITVDPGTYPGQTVTYDSSMEGATDLIRVEATGAKIGGTLEMNGVQHVHLDGLEVTGLWNIRPWPRVSSIRTDSKLCHDLVFSNVTAKTFLIRNLQDAVFKDCKFGGWDASITPLGPPKIGAYQADPGVLERLSTNVLIDNCVFSDMIRTVAGTAHAEGFYFDSGVDGFTMRGCTFTCCAVFDIFSNGQVTGRPITNILIEGCLLDVPRGGVGEAVASAVNFKGGAGKVTLRGNSILGNIRLDTAAYQWVSENNAIWGTSPKPGPTDIVMGTNPGFVAAKKDPCDLMSCYRNDLHVKPGTVAGLAGAGVPLDGEPPPPPPPPDPDTLPLTELSAPGADPVILGWTPVPGAVGYRFTTNGVTVSHTWDATRNQVKFGRAGEHAVHALMPGPWGDWPS